MKKAKDGLEPKFMSTEDGGLVEELIKKYSQCTFRCNCKTVIDNPNFEGYPHSGGISDKANNKWWLYVTCPGCQYAWNWNKLDRQIGKYDDSDVTNRYELFYEEVTRISQQKLLDGIPSPAGALAIVYSIQPTGRKVMITPIIAMGNPFDHVKEIVSRLKPACYIVVTEGWLQKRDKDSLKDYKRGDAEADPNRKEVMSITGRTLDGRFNVTKVFEIRRDSEQKVTKLLEYKEFTNVEVSDRLP